MNKLYVWKTPLLFLAALILLTACGSDDPKSSATEQQLKTLTGTWRVNPATAVTLDGKPLAEWEAFNITITKGTYTTANAAKTTVWPASGAWEFLNDNPNTIRRDGDIVLNVNATATTAELSFTISEEAGRTASISGKYVFTLIKQ